MTPTQFLMANPGTYTIGELMAETGWDYDRTRLDLMNAVYAELVRELPGNMFAGVEPKS